MVFLSSQLFKLWFISNLKDYVYRRSFIIQRAFKIE